MEVDGKDENQHWLNPPNFDFSSATEVYQLQGSTIERKCGTSKQANQCFWRRVIWSPDGSHLLAQTDDHHVDVFQLTMHEDKYELIKVYSLRAPTTLLAIEWYPFARYDDAVSWCFAMSARDIPTRLIDAYQGVTRATYGIMNHVERFIGPQALAFSLDGTKLYCAHDAEISIFNLSCPGTNTHETLKLTPTRRSVSKGHEAAGQRGQVSCLCVVQDHFAGTSQELLAVGTFAGSIGIYQMGEGNQSAEERCLVGWNENTAGVTQLSFHPTAPHILFVTSRRNNEIRAYDLQYIGSRRSFLHPAPDVALLATFSRSSKNNKVETQQRLGFHVDWAGRFLIAGDSDGCIQVWRIDLPSTDKEYSQEVETEPFFGKTLRNGESPRRLPNFRSSVAKDVIASVMLHPTMALIVVASGARHWESQEDGDRIIKSSSEDEEDGDSLGHCTHDGALRILKA